MKSDFMNMLASRLRHLRVIARRPPGVELAAHFLNVGCVLGLRGEVGFLFGIGDDVEQGDVSQVIAPRGFAFLRLRHDELQGAAANPAVGDVA